MNKKKEANWHFFLLGFVWGFFQGKKKKKRLQWVHRKAPQNPKAAAQHTDSKAELLQQG